VQLLIVGEGDAAERLAEALRSGGIAVERASAPATSPAGEGEAARIATAMRAFEELLTADRPDGVLLISSSNAALAALLVATKLGVAVARFEEAGAREDARGEEGEGDAINGVLISRLADTSVAADAEAVAAWLGPT
jgi:UDP-N-acetylglucosamine 2-epimerase